MHHHHHHHVLAKGLFGGDMEPVSAAAAAAAAVSAARLAMLDSLRYLPNLAAHHNPALMHQAQVEHYQVHCLLSSFICKKKKV